MQNSNNPGKESLTSLLKRYRRRTDDQKEIRVRQSYGLYGTKRKATTSNFFPAFEVCTKNVESKLTKKLLSAEC